MAVRIGALWLLLKCSLLFKGVTKTLLQQSTQSQPNHQASSDGVIPLFGFKN
jgi:hypothetical protein